MSMVGIVVLALVRGLFLLPATMLNMVATEMEGVVRRTRWHHSQIQLGRLNKFTSVKM